MDDSTPSGGKPSEIRKKSRLPDFPTRWIVILITFFGFVVSVGLQMSMNIAIVAMVNFTAVQEMALSAGPKVDRRTDHQVNNGGEVTVDYSSDPTTHNFLMRDDGDGEVNTDDGFEDEGGSMRDASTEKSKYGAVIDFSATPDSSLLDNGAATRGRSALLEGNRHERCWEPSSEQQQFLFAADRTTTLFPANHSLLEDENATFAAGRSPDSPISRSPDEEGPYAWDETAQGAILGSYFWGYIMTQLIGGRLAEKFGPKRVLLASILSAAVVAAQIPLVAPYGIQWVIAVRLMQGICQGPTYPIINVVVSRWAISHERSRMIAVLYTGGMMGALVTMYLGGLIIPVYGFASLFYTMSAACLVWGVAFWLLAFDSPAHHPRISREESALFPLAAVASRNNRVRSVPWKGILSSMPVWALILCSMAKGIGVTVMSMMPIYLKAVLGFDMQSSGTYAAVPYIGRVTFPLVFSVFIDWVLRKNLASRTIVRKIASSIDFFGNGVAYLAVSFAGCDSALAIGALCFAMACGGASYSGFSASIAEVSPQYSGTIGGLTATGFSAASMIIPLGVGLILQGQQNLSGWALVYRVGASGQLLAGILFWLMGSTKRQSFDQDLAENPVGGDVEESKKALKLPADDQEPTDGHHQVKFTFEDDAFEEEKA